MSEISAKAIYESLQAARIKRRRERFGRRRYRECTELHGNRQIFLASPTPEAARRDIAALQQYPPTNNPMLLSYMLSQNSGAYDIQRQMQNDALTRIHRQMTAMPTSLEAGMRQLEQQELDLEIPERHRRKYRIERDGDYYRVMRFISDEHGWTTEYSGAKKEHLRDWLRDFRIWADLPLCEACRDSARSHVLNGHLGACSASSGCMDPGCDCLMYRRPTI